MESETKMPQRTCLDCGFLTLRGHEVTHPERVTLGTRGKSAVMPSHPEQTTCLKNLWDYDLHYSGDSWEGVLSELETPRDKCQGFLQYEAGLSPAKHIERQEQERRERFEQQEQERRERFQFKAALLSFFGGLSGALIGAFGSNLPRWLTAIWKSIERILGR